MRLTLEVFTSNRALPGKGGSGKLLRLAGAFPDLKGLGGRPPLEVSASNRALLGNRVNGMIPVPGLPSPDLKGLGERNDPDP